MNLKCSDNKYVSQNELFTISNNFGCRSTKTVNKGKWYFEATHYSGTNYHLFGFKGSSGALYFYPLAYSGYTNQNQYPNVYFVGDTVVDEKYFEVLNISTGTEHTIGIGIDIEKRKFYVFYKNQFRVVDIINSAKIKDYSAIVYGANDETTNEVVSVNFGDYPFEHSLPGFIPWAHNQPKVSCFYKKYENNIFVLSVFLLL